MSPKQKRNLAIAAVIGGAIYLFSKGGASGAGAAVTLGMKPVKVGANEPVTAQSYRIIEGRRSGMTYTAASQANEGVGFFSPVAGMFTRNFVQEGGQLFAEIKA